VAIANWDEVGFNKNGNFIGSSCALAVTNAGFEKASVGNRWISRPKLGNA
jgi:hypothetical protein